MHRALALAIGLAVLILTASQTFALSLSGPSFTIAEDVNELSDASWSMTEFKGGGLGFLYTTRPQGEDIVYERSIYAGLFDANGLPRGDRILVLKARRPYQDLWWVSAGGMLALDGGKTLVGYNDRRDGVPVSFARLIKKRGDVTKEIIRPAGVMLQLATKKRLFISGGEGQFISPTGEFGAKKFQLSKKRSGYQIEARRHRDGFIAHFYKYRRNGIRFAYAQIYGSNGQKIGLEKQIENRTLYKDIPKTWVLGLTDGSIAVVRLVNGAKSHEITAEIFAIDWTLKQSQKTIATLKFTDAIGLEAIEGGDFLVGVTTANQLGQAGGLEVRRFSQTLEPVGEPVRIDGVDSPRIKHLVARQDVGDVVMTYTWYTPEDSRMNFSGQFLKP